MFHCPPFRTPQTVRVAALVLLLPAALLVPQRALASVDFLGAKDGVIESPEGKHLLRWEYPGEKPSTSAAFELQYSTSADFAEPATRYRGRDTATSITGLNEGEHHYRIRLVDGKTVGDWSAPLTIRVQYVGRGVVIVLMTLGLFLFIATTAVIVKGHRDKEASPA